MVTLGNSAPQGKQPTLNMLKSSLLNEEARRKDKESNSNHKALVIESDPSRGRGKQRGPQNENMSRSRLKSKGRLMCFYCGKLGHFQKNCWLYRKDKGGQFFTMLKNVSHVPNIISNMISAGRMDN